MKEAELKPHRVIEQIFRINYITFTRMKKLIVKYINIIHLYLKELENMIIIIVSLREIRGVKGELASL